MFVYLNYCLNLTPEFATSRSVCRWCSELPRAARWEGGCLPCTKGYEEKWEMSKTITGCWFGTFFIFPYIFNNHPNLLICFRGVETTNQIKFWVPNLETSPRSVPSQQGLANRVCVCECLRHSEAEGLIVWIPWQVVYVQFMYLDI